MVEFLLSFAALAAVLVAIYFAVTSIDGDN